MVATKVIVADSPICDPCYSVLNNAAGSSIERVFDIVPLTAVRIKGHRVG